MDSIIETITSLPALATAAALVVVVVADRYYQRRAQGSNEPPMAPYTIPFIGHGFALGRNMSATIKTVSDQFPGLQPFSLMAFGKRIYVFPSPKDANIIYRKSKVLSFLPLVETHVAPAWGISKDGLASLMSEEHGDSMLQDAHVFYRDALKEGPQLEELTLKFVSYVRAALDDWFASSSHNDPVVLRSWSRRMLASAATNAVVGPSILRKHSEALDWVAKVDQSFFVYVNNLPRFVAGDAFRSRDNIMNAFAEYLDDESNRKDGAPMIWERDDQMREKGMNLQDRARYSYSAYAALMTNSVPISASLLVHLYYDRKLLDRIREEIAPVFNGSRDLTSLDQVRAILKDCPLLRASFNEALRIYSPAASNRRVVEDTEVSGYVLKAGRHVLIPSFAHHQLESVFGERTSAFIPDRFLPGGGGDPKQVRAFGGGTTLCSGRYFASNEVMSYVAAVIWRCDVKFVMRGKERRVKLVERDLSRLEQPKPRPDDLTV